MRDRLMSNFAEWKRYSESASLQKHTVIKYIFSIIVVLAAYVLRFALVSAAGELPPFLTFFPAIMVIAILAGLWPGIFATLLSMIIAAFLIITPKGQVFALHGADDISLLIFGLMGVFMSILAQAYRSSRLKACQSEALRESEERFRSAFERGGIPMAMTSLDNKLMKVNPAFCRLLGYTEAQLTSRRFTDITHPDDIATNLAGINEVTTGKKTSFRMEKRYIHKNGSIVWGDMSTASVRDADGKPLYIVTYVQDITERKHAEEALRQSQAMLARAQEIAHVGSWELDLINNDLIWSDEVYRIFGLVPREFGATYEAFLDRVFPDDRAAVDSAYSGSVREGLDSYEIEHRVTRKDTGEIRWVHEKCSHTRDAAGRVIRSLGMVMDITERKQAEESLRHSQERLKRQTQELETIIGIVSHDLRAPLVNVKGFSGEILKDIQHLHTLLSGVKFETSTKSQLDKILHKNLPESLGFIQTSADAMNNLVVTLVEVARAGFAPVRPENLDMNEVMEKILATLEIKIKIAGVIYSVQSMPHCYADRTQVEQIFRNLIDNAIKYLDTERPGLICIGGTLQAGSALYWVADNGIGISVEDQERIFDPYYQLKEKATEGMGLGLATVRRMVDRNDGRIWVISEKGNGSIFYVALLKMKS